MPPKDPRQDPRPELPVSHPEANASLKTIARFLQFLTWLMVVLVVILAYHVLRPQPGRYQLIVSRDEVLVFDSVLRQADILKKRDMGPSEATAPAAPTTGQSPSPDAPATKEEERSQ